ncbi:MAG: hypothetical protein ACI89D_002764, partial [Bermanella sp.]
PDPDWAKVAGASRFSSAMASVSFLVMRNSSNTHFYNKKRSLCCEALRQRLIGRLCRFSLAVGFQYEKRRFKYYLAS